MESLKILSAVTIRKHRLVVDIIISKNGCLGYPVFHISRVFTHEATIAFLVGYRGACWAMDLNLQGAYKATPTSRYCSSFQKFMNWHVFRIIEFISP